MSCSFRVYVAVMSLVYKFGFSWFGAHMVLQLFFSAHIFVVSDNGQSVTSYGQ